MFISVTRLRVRKWVLLFPFFIQNEKTVFQVRRSPGFLAGKLLMDRGLVFWTVTSWKDRESMTAFRNSGVHLKVMPKLGKWCSEASTASWVDPSPEIPAWDKIFERLISEGKWVLGKKFCPPKYPSRFERKILPLR